MIVFVVVAAALHSAETSVGGLVDQVKDQIDQTTR